MLATIGRQVKSVVAVTLVFGYFYGMEYKKINSDDMTVFPLSSRESFIDITQAVYDTNAEPPQLNDKMLASQIYRLAERILSARSNCKSAMLTYGAHIIKNGGGSLLRALMDEGFITHIATQGAGTIHDWEFAFQRYSSESVADNAPQGKFGSWDETGKWLNLAIISGAAEGLGYGQSLGRLISDQGLTLPDPAKLEKLIAADPAGELTAARADLLKTMRHFGLPVGKIEVPHPYKQYSVTACAYENKIPMTVHPGIGYDIIVNHPMYSGAAIGRAATTDVRTFAAGVDDLDGGVYMSVGSAIMSPQIFEKAFSAANNIRNSQGRPFISDHYIAIVDIQDGGNWDWTKGEPPKTSPAYYLRFCKSFHRMGGICDYLCGDNVLVLSNLLAELRKMK